MFSLFFPIYKTVCEDDNNNNNLTVRYRLMDHVLLCFILYDNFCIYIIIHNIYIIRAVQPYYIMCIIEFACLAPTTVNRVMELFFLFSSLFERWESPYTCSVNLEGRWASEVEHNGAIMMMLWLYLLKKWWSQRSCKNVHPLQNSRKDYNSEKHKKYFKKCINIQVVHYLHLRLHST